MSSWRSVTAVHTNLSLHKSSAVLENKHLFGTRIKLAQFKSSFQRLFLETSEFLNVLNSISSYYARGKDMGEKDVEDVQNQLVSSPLAME